MRAVDVYGFAGGFTLGMARAGFELVGKREEEAGFGILPCEENRCMLPGPWEAEARDPDDWTPVRAEVVFGNPPCSGFSGLNRSVGVRKGGVDSAINACMHHLAAYAARVKPELVIMESVQKAGKMGRSLMQELRAKVEAETGLTYDLHHVFLVNRLVGNPQKRPRYFMVLSRGPFGIDLTRRAAPVSIAEAIGDLVGLDYEDPEDQPILLPASTDYQRRLCRPDGLVDAHTRSGGTSDRGGRWFTGGSTNLQRLEAFWGQVGVGKKPDLDAWEARYGDRPSSWGVTRAKRLDPDGPMFTITGAGGAPFLHWAEPRVLTARETARIMGFPDSWRLPARPAVAYAWLGKGVTVHAGRWIGYWARKALEGQPGPTGEPVGDREYLLELVP